MRSVFRFALAGLLLACCVPASGEKLPWPDFAVADHVVPDDPLPPRSLRLASGATVLTDVVYARRKGARPLRLDLYGVEDDGPPRPLVIFVHGGGWVGAGPRSGGAFTNFPEVLAAVAARGFAVASIEYRLRDEARFPGPLLDVRDAVRFLRSSAGQFGIDARRIALWGASAGAQLAALAAVTCDGTPAFESAVAQHDRTSDCVSGFVGWFGPYDLAPAEGRPGFPSATRNLLDCGAGPCTIEALAAASPVHYVDSRDPPVLLVHGTRDRPVPASQATEFAERLRAAGATAEVVLLEGADHAWIGSDAAATQAYSRQALDATVDFLGRVLRPGDASD